jgi:hypothetical protein
MVRYCLARCATRIAVLGLLLSFLVSSVCANAPAPVNPVLPEPLKPPVPVVGDEAPWVVRRDVARAHSRIIVPRKFLPVLEKAPALKSADRGPGRKAMEFGALLAVVVTGGGLMTFFVRRGKVKATVVSAATMLALTVMLGIALAAEPVTPALSPPRQAADANAPAAPVAESPQIEVEVTGTGDSITLVLGSNAPSMSP